MNTQYVQFFFANTKDVKTIEFMCVSIMPIFAILFCKAIARERLRLIWKIIIGLQALIAVMMPFVGQQASIDLLMLAECLVLVDLVYALVVAVRDLYRHAKEHQRITGAGMLREFGSVTLRSVLGNTAIGLVIVLISAAIGVLYSTIIMADQNHIIIGLFAFIISVSYALSNDVIETKHQIAGQNELLEVKVLERTKELEEQTELAVLASETKTRFLATMSHEIRTPMNAIIGISQIELGRNDLDQHTKEALRRIYHSGRGLLGIINDILDLSKAETGSLELVPTEYYFASVLNDVVQLNMVRIAAKPIKFLLEVDPNIPAKLVGDELRLKQICSNILSNAFKYTDEGHVWMQVRLLTQGDRHELFIQVTDTGQGMHKEDADKLFDEYTRFNKSANRTTEGTGLGMSITGRLIKLMQGRIQVDSEFGKGSTFSIWIPQECEDTTPIGEEMARQLGSFQYQDREKEDDVLTLESMPYGKILLVDDVETNLYVAEGLLAPYNLSIERALSGFEAINAVTAGKEYDIIFMDHMMPRMDGVETVRRIRQMGYEGPIVALTANAIAGNDNFFRQNGFDDFVSKPINMKQMDAILHRWIKDRHPEEAAAVGASNMAMQADSSDAAAVRDGALQADTMQQIDTAQPMNAAKKALLEVFARDANQAIQVLGDTYLNGDLPLFAITAHGMKSACLNVGEDVLSNMALQLEKAAKVQDKEQIDQLLPVFLEKLTKRIEEWIVSSAPGPTTEDTKLLREKLHEIRNACESYDEMSANAAIRQLEACSWSQETQELIRTLAGCLLHTDFEEAAQTCEKELQKR
jgi:signal transduction histidine kinase/CheY-like chemotaxis protein